MKVTLKFLVTLTFTENFFTEAGVILMNKFPNEI